MKANPEAGTNRDALFNDPDRPVEDFTFNAETASVFENMLDRSVPFYGEMQRMMLELAGDFAVDGTAIYDLGCSTGTTMRYLDALPQNVELIGIDSSEAMLAKADEHLRTSLRHRYALHARDINESLGISNASVVVMSLTLQFVRPLFRERVLRGIFNGLNENGCLLLIEKIVTKESLLNRLYIDHYYEFKKRNGYSELEIARKREALENVLIPYRVEENEEMLRRVGFRSTDLFFKWYNFTGMVAIK